MGKRILLLADSASSHTEKWASALAEKGFVIGIFSLNKSSMAWHESQENILLLNEPEKKGNADFLLNKLGYLAALPALLRCIKAFRPDVLHAHYASSYGLLGGLSRFSPFVISAWGSDVFDFPKKSFLHKQILKFNLNRADKVLATSHALKAELWNYTHQEVQVIPFGVDTRAFYPQEPAPGTDRDVIRIGLIKSLEDQYGIKTVIEAAELIKTKLPSLRFELYLVGGGSRLEHYKNMVALMDLQEQVIFTGKIPFKKIPGYHNLLDIFLNVTIVDESFGVSVIEAMACEKPVIVTDAPGLKEIVHHESLGITVEKENAWQLAGAIMRLALSPDLRTALGKAGRKHVLNTYDFSASLDLMTRVYRSFFSQQKKRPQIASPEHESQAYI